MVVSDACMMSGFSVRDLRDAGFGFIVGQPVRASRNGDMSPDESSGRGGESKPSLVDRAIDGFNAAEDRFEAACDRLMAPVEKRIEAGLDRVLDSGPVTRLIDWLADKFAK